MIDSAEIDNTPLRHVGVGAALLLAMEKNGETLDDIVTYTEGCYTRAADYELGVVITTRYVYVCENVWIQKENDCWTEPLVRAQKFVEEP